MSEKKKNDVIRSMGGTSPCYIVEFRSDEKVRMPFDRSLWADDEWKKLPVGKGARGIPFGDVLDNDMFSIAGVMSKITAKAVMYHHMAAFQGVYYDEPDTYFALKKSRV